MVDRSAAARKGWDTRRRATASGGASRPSEEARAGVTVRQGDLVELGPHRLGVTVRQGDLVELGPHRLICGDSTDPAVVQRLMQEELADLVFTDPPYGVDYDRRGELRAKLIRNDNLGNDGTRTLIAQSAMNWPLRPGRAFYVCSPPSDRQTSFRLGLIDAKRQQRQMLVWVKNRLVLGRQDYQHQFECILYGWASGAPHYWCGTRKEVDTWFISKPHRSPLHPTMKPIALVARAIQNSSKAGELVFDGFAGSGTTLLAAHELGRRARLIELDPGHCATIISRAQGIGLTPVFHRRPSGRAASSKASVEVARG